MQDDPNDTEEESQLLEEIDNIIKYQATDTSFYKALFCSVLFWNSYTQFGVQGQRYLIT